MKTTKFLKSGNNVRVISIPKGDISDTLAPAVYSVRYDEMSGFYLKFDKERFSVPEKIYGSAAARAEKVINTYTSRTNSTGVMLTGDKGAGKTLTSALMANALLDRGLPVLTINEPYNGSSFNEFINNIGECALFFDEFAKIFNGPSEEDNPQNNLLTLFDGTGSQKRLIILTENNEFKVNEFMRNRPGRVYYHFRYSKLEEVAIFDYCADRGVPLDVAEKIAELAFKMYEFSFDTLQAIVEEYKRYGSDVEALVADLNIDRPFNSFGGNQTKLRVVQLMRKSTAKEVDIRTGREVIDMPEGSDTSKVWFTVASSNGESYNDYAWIDLNDVVVREGNTVVFYDSEEDLLVKAEMFTESTNIDLKHLLV